MFSSSVHQFVKSTGKDVLTPVENVYAAENAKVLQIVVKKKKFSWFSWLFWRKNYKYRLTDFSLEDILQSDTKVPLEVKDSQFVKFNRTTKHSLNGDFGADLMNELLDVDLKGSDSVAVKANFGQTRKKDVELNDLDLELSSRKINLEHDFVKQIRKNKKKSFCVVVGVVYLENDAELTAGLKVDVGADIKTKLLDGNTIDAEVKVDKLRDMVVPKNSALAYSYRELLVNTKSGDITLILDLDSSGGFTDKCEDEPDGPRTSTAKADTTIVKKSGFRVVSPESEEGLAGVKTLKPDETTRLKQIVVSLLKHPSYISFLNRVFSVAFDAVNSKENEVIQLDKVMKKFKLDAIDKKLLDYMMFAHISVENNKAAPPSSDSEIFKALKNLVDALHELEDEELDYLSQISEDHQRTLADLMEASMKNRGDGIMCSGNVKKLLDDENAAGLLHSLGYQLKDSKLMLPTNNETEITAVWWICFVLTEA